MRLQEIKDLELKYQLDGLFKTDAHSVRLANERKGRKEEHPMVAAYVVKKDLINHAGKRERGYYVFATADAAARFTHSKKVRVMNPIYGESGSSEYREASKKALANEVKAGYESQLRYNMQRRDMLRRFGMVMPEKEIGSTFVQQMNWC